MKKEKIICAGILVNGKVYNGHRHNHCLEAMNSELSWTMNRQQISQLEKIQGFITSEGRFVDRQEALKIAREANQILNESEVRGDLLYSEDLY
jgi:hypothetical protein